MVLADIRQNVFLNFENKSWGEKLKLFSAGKNILIYDHFITKPSY